MQDMKMEDMLFYTSLQLGYLFDEKRIPLCVLSCALIKQSLRFYG